MHPTTDAPARPLSGAPSYKRPSPNNPVAVARRKLQRLQARYQSAADAQARAILLEQLEAVTRQFQELQAAPGDGPDRA